jgi:hypothetical protein
MEAIWRLLLKRARKRGFTHWYLVLTSVLAVALGYLGTGPYTAMSFVMAMNCGWGGTGLTLWQDLKDRNAQVDFLLLPLTDKDWRRMLDRFFLLGFLVSFCQFVLYAISLWIFEPGILESFLRLNSSPGVRNLRILFHGLVLLLVIGFFWSGYWASVWRGWPLAIVAALPFLTAYVGYLSVSRIVDMRLALGGMGTGMILLGFLWRHWVGRGWKTRAAQVLIGR